MWRTKGRPVSGLVSQVWTPPRAGPGRERAGCFGGAAHVLPPLSEGVRGEIVQKLTGVFLRLLQHPCVQVEPARAVQFAR